MSDPTPASETPAQTDESRIEVLSQLVVDDAPAETPEPVEAKATEAETQPVAEETPVTETTTETPTHQPGTPDKALQKIQQDLSAANRKLEELQLKVDAGESLTAKEKQQVAAAKRKIDEIRENFDPIDHGETLRDVVLEVDNTTQQLAQENASLKRRLDALEQRDVQREVQTVEQGLNTQYPGVNWQTHFNRSVNEVIDELGLDPNGIRPDSPEYRMVQNAATKRMHKAAAAELAGKQTPAAKPTPKATPAGSTRVSAGGSAVGPARLPSSDDGLARYDILVK